MKTYVLGTHQKCLREVLLISTHNICFRRQTRKISNILTVKIALSGAMQHLLDSEIMGWFYLDILCVR